MKRLRDKIFIHIVIIIGIAALLVLCIVYPFLPGGYDRLAVPISTMIQSFGVVGLPLILVGLFWVMMPGRRLIFAIMTMVLGTFVSLILALFATLSAGNAFGILTFAVWVYIGIQLIPKLRHLKKLEVDHFNPFPLYLIALPILTLTFQLALATPVTQWSKSRVISNAMELIGDIDQYHLQHGHYPLSLEAQNKDYNPDIVGVEKYLYAPYGNSYNLFFEQPRFLLDRLGTREWVVYNPLDEHRVYSHAAWLLTEQVEPSQGWYSSGETGQTHWKYFLFD